MAICSGCKQEKNEFSPSQLGRGNRRRCMNCVRVDRSTYCEKNSEKVRAVRRAHHHRNKEKENITSREWAQNNKSRRNAQIKERRKNDPLFRLRDIVSCSIRSALKTNRGSKNGCSLENYLPYTINELKIHIQNLFETWMTWENQGIYCIETWNDNDPTTWTWQIDHIIPHSTFNYSSMEDEDFQKCWALNNLRPLSAKRNLLKSDRVEVA